MGQESVVIVDALGICTDEDSTEAFLKASEIAGDVYLWDSTNRLSYLSRLAHGVGVVVITGPLGAPFWSVASDEVKVLVEPDGYEYKERHDLNKWQYLAVGLGSADARELAKRTKPPTDRHRLKAAWEDAQELRRRYEALLADADPLVVDAYPHQIVKGEDGLALVAALDTATFSALDFEWHRQTQDPLGLIVTTAEVNSYVPVRALDYGVPGEYEGYGDALRGVVAERLRSGVPCVFHGGRADLATQYPGDPVELVGQPIHDTLVQAYLADPYSDDLGLKELTRTWLGREPVDNPGELADMPLEKVARYAASDGRNTYDLFRKLVGVLVETDQWEVYDKIERPLMPLIASIEKYGSPVDVPELLRLYREYATVEVAMRRVLTEMYEFDPRDSAETRAWLKGVLGHDPGTLDQRVLSLYPQPEIDLYLFFKTKRTRRRNFMKGVIKRWVAAGRPEDFRLYPKFNQAGKDAASGSGVGRAPRSGRLSSSSGSDRRGVNFQNQPRDLRAMYVAPRGYRFWSKDYKGLELTIAAAISGDTLMVNTLNGGGDLHGVYGEKLQSRTGKPWQRIVVKMANFEGYYKGGANTLIKIAAKERVSLTTEEAKALVDGHVETFAEYHKDADEEVVRARQRGYGLTLFGRRRYEPALFAADPEIRGHAERAIINHRIQGTAADIVKMAMIRLVPVMQKYGGHIAIQVHDEVCGWIREDADLEAFEREVDEAMTGIELPHVKLVVEGGIGTSWAEVH